MAEQPPDLPKLPSAEEALAGAVTQRLDPDHRRRANEASVRKLELINEIIQTAATQADNDRTLREEITGRVFRAIVVQVLIADFVFVLYGCLNDWFIPATALDTWLGAAVVQVIAVGLVIARSLYPKGGVNPALVTEALHESRLITGDPPEATDDES